MPEGATRCVNCVKGGWECKGYAWPAPKNPPKTKTQMPKGSPDHLMEPLSQTGMSNSQSGQNSNINFDFSLEPRREDRRLPISPGTTVNATYSIYPPRSNLGYSSMYRDTWGTNLWRTQMPGFGIEYEEPIPNVMYVATPEIDMSTEVYSILDDYRNGGAYDQQNGSHLNKRKYR